MQTQQPAGYPFVFEEKLSDEEDSTSHQQEPQTPSIPSPPSPISYIMSPTNKKNQTLQTKIISVKPPPHLQCSQDLPANELLYNSQNSETSQLQNQKTFQKEETHSTNIIFETQDFEQSEISPQSSLRKLYKHPKLNSPPKIYEQQPQKIIKVDAPRFKIMQRSSESENSDFQEEEEPSFYKAKQLKSSSLFDLVIYPIPQQKMVKCLVIVTSNNFFSLESIFDLYLVQDKKHLLRARKKRFRLHSSFEIYGREEKNPISLVCSNFTRTQYKLIEFKNQILLSDKSTEPIQAFSSDIIKVQQIPPPVKKLEEESSYIAYQSNFLGFSQQRLMMLKPKKSIPKSDRFSDLKTAYENCQYERVETFSTRMAEKGLDGKLTLDFKDKTITNSTRNMIVENEQSEAGLMFAKFSENIYILNVMHPFSLLEGFFLGLCNLDRKPLVS